MGVQGCSVWPTNGESILQDLNGSVDHVEAAPIDTDAIGTGQNVNVAKRCCIVCQHPIRCIAALLPVNVHHKLMIVFVECLDQADCAVWVFVSQDAIANPHIGCINIVPVLWLIGAVLYVAKVHPLWKVFKIVYLLRTFVMKREIGERKSHFLSKGVDKIAKMLGDQGSTFRSLGFLKQMGQPVFQLKTTDKGISETARAKGTWNVMHFECLPIK